jgi:hypothetical protein
MCKYSLGLINFETLTEQQKKKLKQEILRRERALKKELGEVNRALRTHTQKSKRKKSKRK